MPNVKYPRLMSQCLHILAQNRKLFLPNFIMVVLSTLLIVMFTVSTGLFAELVRNPLALIDPELLGSVVTGVKDAHPGWFWSMFTIYIITVYCIDMFFITTKYGMIKDALTIGETSLWSGMVFAYHNYWKSFVMHLISYFLVISPAFFIAALGIVAGITAGFFQNTVYMIMFIVFIIIVLIYWVQIFFRLVFLYPTMAFGGTRTFESFREDFHYVKSHLSHTFISWIIFIGVWIVYFITKTPFGRAASSTQSIGLIVGITVFTILTEMVVSTFEHTFLFKAYLDGQDSKRIQSRRVVKNWKDIYI